MKIHDMNNVETKAHILKWCELPSGPFSWPTDGCGYDQHIKFVTHRNENWKGGNTAEFLAFVREYANSLVSDDPTNDRETISGGEIEEGKS